MKYYDALAYYGTDKPDTRFEYLISDISTNVKSNYKYAKAIFFDKNVVITIYLL